MSESLAIDVRGVEKRYGRKIHALRGVSLTVHRGEIFGLLGPNGAGKSTLVKILLTVIRPTRCAGLMLGKPVGHKPTLARVGFLPEAHRFPRYLTGRQILRFFGALGGVSRQARRRRSDQLLELLGMTAWADKKVGTYSKGMAQRIGLANALINDPDLVILDEPTDGVDPLARRHIRDVLATLRDAGKAVFINSHLLSELEMVCDRVAIMVAGQIARQGTVHDLSLDKQCYEIELTAPLFDVGQFLEDKQLARFDLLAQPGLPRRGRARAGEGETWIEQTGGLIRVGTPSPHNIQPILDALRGAGAVIARVHPVRPSLEDMFMEIVERQGGGIAAGAQN